MGWQDHYQGKSVLVTGASSGIGEEIARQCAGLGAHLTLMARRLERLEQLRAALGEKVQIVRGDVTQQHDLEQAVALAVAASGRLDIAIANAGFGVAGSFAKLQIEDYRRQFETNVFGVLRTIYAVLPALKASRGQLVLIGSVAGWIATPGTSAYAMSKFAVRALAEAIGPELTQVGVRLTLISPGFIDSEIRRVDNQGRFHAEAHEPIPPWLLVRREPAVRQILRAVAGARREAVITGHGKLLVAMQRFAPWITRRAAKKMAARGRGYRSEPGT